MAALVRRRTERRPGAILGRSVQTVRQVRALHAAATAYDLSNLTRGDAHRLMAYRQGWQERAYGYRSDVGELRYAVAFLANAAKRMMFYPAVYMPGERVPVPIEDSDLKQHTAIAHDALDRLGDVGCRSTLASDQMAGFEVAGECYLVSREDDSDGIKREVWEMRSLSEVQASEDGKVLIKDIPGSVGATWTSRDSSVYVMQPDDYLARMWRPDPQWRRLADSPVRAAESVLEELVILGKDVRAGGVSRLVNNGILLIPDDLSVVRNSTGLDDEAGDDEDDEFLVQMIEAATTAIMDPGSAAAALPIVARGPAETLDKVKLLAMIRPEDKNADKRQEALRRLATALDLPAEVLTGIADVNHWGAWQVDDSTFRHHVEPLVQDEVDSWTAAYFRRYLTAAGVPEDAVARMVIWYDPTELLTKPDRSTDAKDAHTAHVLSDEALRRHLGFTEDEAPSDEELAVRLLFQSRTLDPDLAKQLVLLLDPRLKMPEPQPPVIAPPPPPVGEQPPGEQTPETGPAPSETGPPPEAEGLRARVTELRALAAERGSAAELRRRVVELKAAKAAEVTELEALLAASHITPDWAYDLSRRMAERDQQTREALRMACEHAVRRVLERAGNKVVTRARQKDALTASTLAGVPQWAVPGRLGPAVVAALGLSEDALLKDELVDLRRTWDQYISTGQTQALRDAARLVGMDVNTAFAQLDGTFRADREAGWSFLREVLDRNTRAGLVKDPTELVETGQLVPTSGVRAAIAVAGGYNTRTSSGLNSETLLPADPKEHFGQLGTGTTIKGFLEQNGAKVERYRWSHGLSISPFPPHAALDGFEFDDWDDTRLVHAGFPGDLHPGDHSGCNCDAVLVWVPPAEVVEQVAAPLQLTLTQAMREHTELPLDTPDATKAQPNYRWWVDDGYAAWEKYADCERTRFAADDLLGFRHYGWDAGVPQDADYTRAERMLDWLASPETDAVRVTDKEPERAGRWAGYVKTSLSSQQVNGKWVDTFKPKTRVMSRQMHIPDERFDDFVRSLDGDLDLSLVSFHGLTDAQAKKQDWGQVRPGKSVVLRLVGNPRVIVGWNNASELVTGGRFKVLAHGVKGDHYEVVIKQEGVFNSQGELIP